MGINRFIEEPFLEEEREKGINFHGISTGCGCCSRILRTEKEIKKEVKNSLYTILYIAKYFNWDLDKLIKEVNK